MDRRSRRAGLHSQLQSPAPERRRPRAWVHRRLLGAAAAALAAAVLLLLCVAPSSAVRAGGAGYALRVNGTTPAYGKEFVKSASFRTGGSRQHTAAFWMKTPMTPMDSSGYIFVQLKDVDTGKTVYELRIAMWCGIRYKDCLLTRWRYTLNDRVTGKRVLQTKTETMKTATENYIYTDESASTPVTDAFQREWIMGDDQWHHYVFECEPVEGRFRFIRDGKVLRAESGFKPSAAGLPLTAVLTFGHQIKCADASSCSDMTMGHDSFLDDLAVYNVTLGAAALAAHAAGSQPAPGADGLDASRMFLWRFDDGNVAKVTDSGVYGVLGTPVLKTITEDACGTTLAAPLKAAYNPSSAPLFNADQVVLVRYNVLRSFRLGAGGAEGSTTFTLASLPVYGTLRDKAGQALGVGAVLSGGDISYQGPVNSTLQESFQYTVSDGAGQATGTVRLVPKQAAYALLARGEAPVTLRTYSDRGLSFLLPAWDPDGAPLAVTLVTLPAKGTLQRTVDFVRPEGAVTAAELLAGGAFQKLYYSPAPGESGNPYASLSFYATDVTGAKTATATVLFVVKPVSRPPVLTHGDYTTFQDTPVVVTLKAESTNPKALLYASVAQYPGKGSLYAYDASKPGGVGELIPRPAGVGASSVAQTDITYQFASRVLAVSSEETPTSWNAQQILGPPALNAEYGDNPDSWAGADSDTPIVASATGGPPHSEWIELQYKTPVYVTNVEIFENNVPGSVVAIYARNLASTTDPKLKWDRIWEGEPVLGCPAEYRFFQPDVCITPYRTDALRIEFDTYSVKGWNDIDAVLLGGLERFPPTIFAARAGDGLRLVYLPDSPPKGAGRDADGFLYDSFAFVVNDCNFLLNRRKSPLPLVLTNVRVVPTGDGRPFPLVPPTLLNATLAARRRQSLAASATPVGEILSLPSYGSLSELAPDGATVLAAAIPSAPYALKAPANRVRYNLSPTAACGLTDSFSYRVVASGTATVLLPTTTVYVNMSRAAEACPAGSFPTDCGCERCRPGTALAGGLCLPCGPGTYAPDAGSSACIACPAGTFAAGNGSAACTLCPRGRYQPLAGRTACLACPAGQYQDREAQMQCESCDVASYSNASETATCAKCPDNANTISATAGRGGALSGAACACRDGYYSLKPLTGAAGESCLACPSGASCPGGPSLLARPGYWSAPDTPDIFVSCVNGACVGGEALAVNGTTAARGAPCAPGYGGTLCAECEAGYGRVGDFECKLCDGPSTSVGLVVAGLLVVVVVGAVIMRSVLKGAGRDSSTVSIVIKIFLSYVQLNSFARNYSIAWPAMIQELYSKMASVTSPLNSIISVDCALPTVQLSISVDALIPRFYAKVLLFLVLPAACVLGSALYFGALHLLRRALRSFKRRPSGAVAAADAEQGPATTRSTSDWDRFVAAAVVLVFLVHPSFAETMFTVYRCRRVGDHHYIAQSMSLQCYTTKHVTWMALVAVFGLSQVFGIPAVMFVVLWRGRKQGRVSDPSFVMRYAFIFRGYRHEQFYYELVVVFRKLAIIAVTVFLAEPADVQTLFALFVMVFFLFVSRAMAPFERPLLNQFEFLSVLASSLTLYIGMFYISNPQQPVSTDRLLTAFLFLVNLAYVVLFGYMFVRFGLEVARPMAREAVRLTKQLTTRLLTTRRTGGGTARVAAAKYEVEEDEEAERRQVAGARAMAARLPDRGAILARSGALNVPHESSEVKPFEEGPPPPGSTVGIVSLAASGAGPQSAASVQWAALRPETGTPESPSEATTSQAPSHLALQGADSPTPVSPPASRPLRALQAAALGRETPVPAEELPAVPLAAFGPAAAFPADGGRPLSAGNAWAVENA